MRKLHLVDSDLPARMEPGIYELIALDKTGKIVPVSRACGMDRRGVLYIGQTKVLKFRLKLLRSRKHIATHVLDSPERYKLKLLAPQLGVRFAPYKSPKEAKEAEAERFKWYVRKFGELPPLNTQGFLRKKKPATGAAVRMLKS